MKIGAGGALFYDGVTGRWLLFDRPREVLESRSSSSVKSCLRALETRVQREGLWGAGFMAYEAAPAFDAALVVGDPGDFPLLWFGIYEEPRIIDLPDPPEETSPDIPWEALLSEGEYRGSFKMIKDYIANGHTYQVNYTFRLRAPFAGNAWDLFLRMVHAQQKTYGACLDTGRWVLCCASPELFFALDGDVLSCRPMKGTAPRGLTRADDLERAEWLGASEKNRAENVMIVDMVRNDLGRIARRGTVEVTELFSLEQYPTLWQMTSTVRCETDAGISGIFSALFPSASITGAPKVRTMEIINELERTPRRVYTGTLGYLAPGRRAQFNVAIRTVLVDRGRGSAEYGTGGGIVWDSEERDELDECHRKARILTQSMPRFCLLETMLWLPGGGFPLLEDHLARLSASAAYFGRPLEGEGLRGRLQEAAAHLSPEPHLVRLLVPAPPAEPVIEVLLLKDRPPPLRIATAAAPVDSGDVFLYHKTTFRRAYDRARSACPGFDDLILWNEKGEVTETCIANIVVKKKGRLLTPPVRCGLLAGIGRSCLLREGSIEEEILRLEDLRRCDGIFLVNAVRGIWEIFPEGAG